MLATVKDAAALATEHIRKGAFNVPWRWPGRDLTTPPVRKHLAPEGTFFKGVPVFS